MERCHILVALRPSDHSFSPEDKVLGLFNGDSPYRLGKTQSGTQEFLHHETGNRLVVYNISPRDISSSAVRKKSAHGKPMDNLLPLEVETYIMKHKVYRTTSQPGTR